MRWGQGGDSALLCREKGVQPALIFHLAAVEAHPGLSQNVNLDQWWLGRATMIDTTELLRGQAERCVVQACKVHNKTTSVTLTSLAAKYLAHGDDLEWEAEKADFLRQDRAE